MTNDDLKQDISKRGKIPVSMYDLFILFFTHAWLTTPGLRSWWFVWWILYAPFLWERAKIILRDYSVARKIRKDQEKIKRAIDKEYKQMQKEK